MALPATTSGVPAAGQKLQNIPAFQVVLDGVDITGRIRQRLISLTLTEKRGGEADQLDLVLDDSDGKLAIPKTGVSLLLSLGWKQGAQVTPGLVAKGRFKVDEASHSGPPDQVTIRARSADLGGDYRVRRERSFKGTTLGAVLEKIAGDNGLEPRIDPALATIAIPVLTQHEKSDMALVRELGRKHDATATIKDGKLLFAPIGKATTTTGKKIPALQLTRRDGDRHDYRRVERGKYDGAEARWHDQDAAARKSEKVGSTGKGKPKRLKKVYATKADAKAAAAAEARRIARGAAEFDYSLALGRADLYPDRAVTVSGFKAEIDARKWLIAEASHTLDGSGYRTKLKLETAA